MKRQRVQLDLANEISEPTRWHVYPVNSHAHEMSEDCWCLPEMAYQDEGVGYEVWIHRSSR